MDLGIRVLKDGTCLALIPIWRNVETNLEFDAMKLGRTRGFSFWYLTNLCSLSFEEYSKSTC